MAQSIRTIRHSRFLIDLPRHPGNTQVDGDRLSTWTGTEKEAGTATEAHHDRPVDLHKSIALSRSPFRLKFTGIDSLWHFTRPPTQQVNKVHPVAGQTPSSTHHLHHNLPIPMDPATQTLVPAHHSPRNIHPGI